MDVAALMNALARVVGEKENVTVSVTINRRNEDEEDERG